MNITIVMKLVQMKTDKGRSQSPERGGQGVHKAGNGDNSQNGKNNRMDADDFETPQDRHIAWNGSSQRSATGLKVVINSDSSNNDNANSESENNNYVGDGEDSGYPSEEEEDLKQKEVLKTKTKMKRNEKKQQPNTRASRRVQKQMMNFKDAVAASTTTIKPKRMN